MKNLIIGILFFLLAQILTWFHIQGQFIWDYFKENPWVISLMGIPISYFYIIATKYTVEGLDGLLWPTRFISFGIGIIVYAILVGIFFKEGISIKTLVSLTLSITIILIQVLWK
tara:strand:- start:159 stop:500 length:342 start_codon:yes stop_codon:yes gene_type:complete